jgi:cell division transport system permease protein
MQALRHYFRLHRENCVDAVVRIVRQPFASGLTILVIAIALALPAGLRVAVNNADAVSESWQGAADFTVYLKLDVTTDAARRAARTIEARDDVDVEALASAVGKLPEADVVQVDTAWVARLRAMLALASRIVDFATVLLGLAVAIVVGNTIRLEINNRSVEIEVTKLVGGTDGFIRRPFLYLGLWYGLAGALVAALVVAVGLALLDPPVRALAGLYGSSFSLRGLSPGETGVLLAGGAVLGWAGAGLAAARHLKAIEPK